MSSIITQTGKVFNLATDAELFRALQAVAAWPDLLTKVTDRTSLLEFLADGGVRFKNPKIREAFEESGIKELVDSYDIVAAKLDALLAGAGSIASRPIAKLLDRVDRYPLPGGKDDSGLLVWKVLDTGKDIPVGSTDLTFEVKGALQLEVEAGDNWTFWRDHGGDDPELGQLLRLAAVGSIEGKIGGSVPFKFGSIEFGADAQADVRLTYFHRARNGSALYALAVADAISEIANPLDFNEVWNKLTTTNLKGIALRVEGSFGFNVDVAVAAAAEIATGLKIGAGLTVGASVRRKSLMELSMRATGPTGAPGDTSRSVAVVLSRASSHSASLGVDLTVEIDASQLAARVGDAVTAELGRWDQKIERIRPLLNPGSWLRDKLAAELDHEISTLVGNAGLANALVVDMKAALGIDAPSAQASNWLRDRILAAIAHEADKVHAAVMNDPTAKKIAAAVTPVFKQVEQVIPATILTAAQAEVDDIMALVQRWIQRYIGEAKQVVTDVFAKTGAQFSNLLDDLGAAVNGVVVNADDALSAVRDLFAQYDEKLEEIRELIAKSAKAKLQAEFIWEESRSRGNEVLISGTFTQGTTQAKQVYDTLVRGDLGHLMRLVSDHVPTPGFALDRTNSWIARTAGWQEKSGFRLTMFGISTAGTRILSSDAKMVLDGNGDLVVYASSDAVDKLERKSGQQILSFSSSFAVGLAKSGQAKDKLFSVSLNIQRDMKNVTADAMRKLLDDLCSRGLLSKDACVGATNAIKRWTTSSGALANLPAAAGLQTSLRIGMRIDGEALLKLMQIDALNQYGGVLPESTKLKIVDTVVRALSAAGAFTTVERKTAINVVRAELLGTPHLKDMNEAELFYTFATRQRINPDIVTGENAINNARGDLVRYVGGYGVDGKGAGTKPLQGSAIRFIDAIDALGDIWNAKPTSADPAPAGFWNEVQYRNAGQRLAKGMSVWLTQPRLLESWDQLRPELVAGLLALGELSGQLTIPSGGKAVDGDGILHVELSNDTETLAFA